MNSKTSSIREIAIAVVLSVTLLAAACSSGSSTGAAPVVADEGSASGSAGPTSKLATAPTIENAATSPTAVDDATAPTNLNFEELLAGVRAEHFDYEVGRTPSELRSFVDKSVRGVVVGVHPGRTLRDLLNPSGLNDRTYATLEIQGEEFASLDGSRKKSTFYVEIYTGNLLGGELSTLFGEGSEVIAFGVDNTEVELGEQWAIDNPLGGRPDADQSIFTIYPQGLMIVTEQSVVGVYDELTPLPGWGQLNDFSIGADAADWIVRESEK